MSPMKKRKVAEWKVQGMMSYLTKLGALVQNANNGFSVSEKFKASWHQYMLNAYHKNELTLETLNDRITESFIIGLKECKFFKQPKSTKEVEFAVEIMRTFGDDKWVENLARGLGT